MNETVFFPLNYLARKATDERKIMDGQSWMDYESHTLRSIVRIKRSYYNQKSYVKCY